MERLFFILAVCYSAQDLMNTRCDEFCHENYDGGYWKKSHCICFDQKELSPKIKIDHTILLDTPKKLDIEY